MLTAEGCRARRERLMRLLGQRDVLVLINDPLYAYYLANLWISPNSLNAYGECWLIIKPDGTSILLVDNFSRKQIPFAHVDRVEMIDWYTLNRPGDNRAQHLNDHLLAFLKKELTLIPPIACCMERMPYDVLHSLEGGKNTFNITPMLEQMRRRKDADEIDLIERCMAVGEAIHAASWEFVRPGVTNLDVYSQVHLAALQAAGEPLVMRCDVNVSPVENPSASEIVLREGMLVILDLFPLLQGYRCDITNTICVGGEPTARQAHLFDLCRKAMAAGEMMLKPGAKACDVYSAVRQTFEQAGEAALFPHHAGHAIGLRHPEPPYLIPGDAEPLQPDMVLTLEPGLYDPQAGGMRFENNYLVTAQGMTRLSHHRIALA